MAEITSVYLTAYFFDAGGSPATGLTPTIDVYKVSDDTKVVNAKSMSEIGGGFYKWLWNSVNNSGTLYDTDNDYVIVADGGTTLIGSARYATSVSGDKSNIEIIKERTDNLPESPIGEDTIIEGTHTFADMIRLTVRWMYSRIVNAGSQEITIRDLADSKDSAILPTDEYGQRKVARTLDGT